MKNVIFITILIITLIATFPLLSCGGSGSPAPAAPSPTTEAAVTTTTAATTPPLAITRPATTTTPPPQTPPPASPSPSPATTTPAPSTLAMPLPDLKPYLVDGKAAVTADTSGTDYSKFSIKAGVTNDGNAAADNVMVELYDGNVKLYTWTVSPLKSGENKVLEATVADILKQSLIYAGQYSLNINCVLGKGGTEIDGTNNRSDTYKVILAAAPVERRAPQSNIEKMIQDAIDNSTWYTNSNKAELVTILKDVLKNVNITWTTLIIDFQPGDKFGDTYANIYGKTDAEKQELKKAVEEDKLACFGFWTGTNLQSKLYVKEGTFFQVVTPLLELVGEANCFYKNYSVFYNGYEMYSPWFAGSLMEAYGIKVMCENYGLGGLLNMSAIVNTVPHPDLQDDSPSSVNLKRMWTVASIEGYPDGNMPASKILKVYNRFIENLEVKSYLADLDKKGNSLDTGAIENYIRWRPVNKDLTMLSADIAKKIDPSATSLSLDKVLSHQEFMAFPW